MRQSLNNPAGHYNEEEQSEEQQQSEDERSHKRADRRYFGNVPRFVKNQIDENEITKIVLNVSKTHYQVIERVSEELGWTIEWSKKSHKWDVMWVDGMIEAHDLFKLNQHQKISHFPAISVLARKDFLGRGLSKLSKEFPEQYNFFPTTWAVPADFNDLLRYNDILAKEDRRQFFIFKPQASSQGKGIKITDKIQQLVEKSGVVQVYINNPYLIEGLKFDLRIYVLLAGCDPLRIYIYQQGLGRFATQEYKKAKKINIKETCMHLTNYAINKLNHKFVFNQSESLMNKGHKRSLTSVYQYLQKAGVNIKQVKERIDSLIVKTIIMGQPMLAHVYGLSQPDNYANDMCFQILGFDVMIDQDLNPVLLEVNHTPSFATDTPLDRFIKKSLIKDTLNLLNVNVSTKKAKIQQKQEFIQLRSQNKNIKLTPKQKTQLKDQAQLQRDRYEGKNLGRYRRLPVSDGHYPAIIKVSKKLFDEHYGFKKKVKSMRGYSLQRPFSLTKSIQKEQFNHRESLPDHNTVKLKSNSNYQMSSSSAVYTPLPSQSLKSSYQRFPTIQTQQSVKKPYMRPIVGEIHKNSPKYHGQEYLLGNDSQRTQKKLRDIHQPRGNYLAPKILKIGQIGTNQYKKKNFQQLQQTLINKKSTVARLSIRKKLECENILKTLIFKKIRINSNNSNG